jgi:DNA-binding beta-propeller fold protein YncE
MKFDVSVDPLTSGETVGILADTPVGVAVTATDVVYVANHGGDQVRKLEGITDSGWTAPAPRGVAVGANGRVYVASESAVRELGADGNPLRLWGSFGSGNGQFNFPDGIAASGDVIYVADRNNHHIVRMQLL